jgi:hypothetical protein
MYANKPADFVLHVRIPEDLREQLHRTACRERNGISAVARRLLARAIEDEDRLEAERHARA